MGEKEANALPPVFVGAGCRTILGKAFPVPDFPGSVFDLIFFEVQKKGKRPFL